MIAKEALERIVDLFAIEREIRGPEQRLEVQGVLAALLDELKAFLDTSLALISRKRGLSCGHPLVLNYRRSAQLGRGSASTRARLESASWCFLLVR